MGKHYLIWMNMTIEPLIGGLIPTALRTEP